MAKKKRRTRKSTLAAIRAAIKKSRKRARRNPVLSKREGASIMRRASRLKKAGKRVPTKFVTKRGRVRTLKAAELRMQGKRVNSKGGIYRTKKGRRIQLGRKSGGGSSGSAYEPMRVVGIV